MTQLTLFRILTFTLLPFAALFGFLGLLVLLSAFANPALLLPAFMFICFVLYTFSSLSFLSKGIDRGQPLKASLRDWIRVNSFVCMATGALFLINSLSIYLMGPLTLQTLVTTMMESQPNMPANVQPELLIRFLKIAAGLMMFVSMALLTHLFLNFRMMKHYRHLFGGGD